MMLNERVAAEVRADLARFNMRVTDLAHVSGVPYQTLRRYLRAERDIPLNTLEMICGALGVEVSEILERAS